MKLTNKERRVFKKFLKLEVPSIVKKPVNDVDLYQYYKLTKEYSKEILSRFRSYEYPDILFDNKYVEAINYLIDTNPSLEDTEFLGLWFVVVYIFKMHRY